MDDLQMDITLLGMSADDLSILKLLEHDIKMVCRLFGCASLHNRYYSNSDVDTLLREIRGIADVSQDEFDECWNEMLCSFPANAPLTLARALKAFVLEGGKLPVIP